MSSSPLPLAARLTPDGKFYGWTVAWGACAITFVTSGIGFYGQAVLLKPLRKAHHWSNGSVSGAIGLYYLIAGIVGILIGRRIDRLGIKRLIYMGTAIMTVAIIAVGYAHTLPILYLDFAVWAVGFGLGGGLVVSAMITRWFVLQRGQALSIALTGVSVGGLIFSPLTTKIIATSGLRTATLVLAIVVIAVAWPVATFVLADWPADYGLLPDGAVALDDHTDRLPSDRAVENVLLSATAQQRIWTRREASGTRAFWLVMVTATVLLTSQTGFLLHQVSFLTDRFSSAQTASLTLSAVAVASIISRAIIGQFVDAMSKRYLMAALMMMQAIAIFTVIHVENRIVTFVCVGVVGLTIGTIFMSQQLIIGEIFGMVSFPVIFGMVGMANNLGSAIGPTLVGWADDHTGSYVLPFTIGAIVTVGCAIAIAFARPPRGARAELADVARSR